MAYAEDLKSSDAKASCGFDPHPGYQSSPAYGCVTTIELMKHCVPEFCGVGGVMM
jgi:hypothetical protein